MYAPYRRRGYSFGRNPGTYQIQRGSGRAGGYGYNSRPIQGSITWPLSQAIETKHRYVDRVSVNAGAGSYAIHTMSANGLFDPNVTGVGHQPLGFDELTAMFSHYTVTNCKIKVNFSNENMPAIGGQCGVLISGEAAPVFTNATHLLEQRGAKHVMVMPAGTESKSVTHYVNVPSYMAKTKRDILGDSLYRGSATANPSEQVYFVIFVGAINSNDDPAPVDCLVDMEFDVVWSESKTLGQS